MATPRAWLSVTAFLAMLVPALSSADVIGTSTSTVGPLTYVGLGDAGGGVGTGRYTLGSCTVANGFTTCTLTGRYVESAQSTRAPGQPGSFTIVQTYPGAGSSPAIGQSISPGNDQLTFSQTGNALFTLTLAPDTGGTISSVYPATIFADSLGFAAFLEPGNFSCTGLAAGQACSVGQVGLVPGAVITGGVQPFSFTIPGNVPPPGNYQGLWWNLPAESESGWGLNLAHQGSVIFATWFTYDVNGKAWWLTMTAEREGGTEAYSGKLYQTNGPAFNAVPFNPAQVSLTEVGAGRLAFTSPSNGTFTYTVNGVTQTKTIIPQVFGPVPICRWGMQPDLTKATNYTDLWWASPAASESGWGINFTHQGTAIFATWFTYDVAHNPLWYSFTAFQTAPGKFAGDIYRTVGPAFSAVPFDPHAVTRTQVGTAALDFTNGNTATFAYTVNDGANQGTQIKNITRQIFRPPGTVCE